MIDHPVYTLEIPTDDDHPVRGDLYLPRSKFTGIVLLCHGFKGYKTWGFFPYLSEQLRDAGIVALSLDMSFNGTIPAPSVRGGQSRDARESQKVHYVRPDLFERNTLRREYRDLAHAIHYVSQGGLRHYIDAPLMMGLFGHSRGGIAALLNAIEQPAVNVLATWSTIDDPDFFSSDQKEKWRREKKYYFVDSTDGTKLCVDICYLDDLEENHGFYHLAERARELRTPHLIVHGKLDMVVPVDCALVLHQAERQLKHKKLLVLQTGHTFGIPYPPPPTPVQPSAALKQATEETVSWFARFFGNGGP